MLLLTAVVAAAAAAAALASSARAQTCATVDDVVETCTSVVGSATACGGLEACTVEDTDVADSAQPLNPGGTVCFAGVNEGDELVRFQYSCANERVTVQFGGNNASSLVGATARNFALSCAGKQTVVESCSQAAEEADGDAALAITTDENDETFVNGAPRRVTQLAFSASTPGFLATFGVELTVASECPLFESCSDDSTVSTERLTGLHLAFSAEGAAEWHAVGVVDLTANGDGGELTRIDLDQAGTTNDDGLREFTVTNSVGGTYTVTAFWAADVSGGSGSVPDANGGGHFHTSSQCGLTCDGARYEQHHFVSATDRQGVHVTFANSTGTPVEIQLAYVEYRNADVSDSTPLEVCVGADDARDFSSFSEWANCNDGTQRTFDSSLYTASSCCSRLVFGCVFAEPADGADDNVRVVKADQYQCLYDAAVLEGETTRASIDESFDGLADAVDATAVTNATEDASAELEATLEQFRATFEALVNETENAVRNAVWNHFDMLATDVWSEGNATRDAIDDAAASVAGVYVEQQNATREDAMSQVMAVEELVADALAKLEEQAALVANVTVSVVEANQQTLTNIELVSELSELLASLPQDLTADTAESLEFAEQSLLIGLFQLKARLHSMDIIRKDVLDELKSELTVQRVKLERNNQLIRRWEGSDGEWERSDD